MAIDDRDGTERANPSRWQPRQFLRKAGRAALDVVLPPLCLHCQKRTEDHNTLCATCWRQIDFIRPPLCDRLGIPLPYSEHRDTSIISAAAAANPPDYHRARAVGHFDGPLRDMIHDLKFHDNPSARYLFARWLSEAGRDLLADADALVPVPLSYRRLVQRRFNQAQVLAASVHARTEIPVWPRVLQRKHRSRHQVGLTALERQRNVAGVFKVPDRATTKITGKNLVLIDDVITTGATVSAAARALKKAGAARVDVLALAIVTSPHP